MPISTRSLSGEDLIQLPRFDAVGAVALGEQLVSAARAVAELPRSIRRVEEMLEADLASLRVAVAARLARAAAPKAEVIEADRALDLCWTGLYDWLAGFAKLPGEPARETLEARALLDELYPDGLSFVLLPYHLEWDQSDQRLARLSNEPLGDRIRALGGQVFLDALTSAHAGYGKLLGLPKTVGPEGPEKSVHEALEAFVSTLRTYALKVTAHVEVGEPETAALANALLAPLLNWEASTRIPALDTEGTWH